MYTSTNPGCYAIGSAGPDISAGQAIEILLGGHWIAGHVAYGTGEVDPTRQCAAETVPQNIGAYYITNDEVNDVVTEASEESFPASDAPSWAGTPEKSPRFRLPGDIVNSYYFIADVDASICGLCIGMQVRTR